MACFNDAINSSDNKEPNVTMIMNDEVVIKWMEKIVVYFKTSYRRFTSGNEKNHEESRSCYSANRLRSETVTFRIQFRSVTNSAKFIDVMACLKSNLSE